MRKKKIIGSIGLLALLLLISTGFFDKGQAARDEAESTESLGIPVEVFVAKSEYIREELNYMGTVRSKNQADLSFRSPGILHKIHVAEGDHFLEGQILAELNTDDLSAKYAVAQEKVAGARLNVEYLKDQTDKTKMLYDEGAVSYQQYLDIEYKYQMAVVASREALAVANEIGVSINNARIHAPYDGSVRALFSQEGEMVQPGQAVCSVSEMDDLIISVAIIEKDLPAVSIGAKVVLSIVEGTESVSVDGSVRSISPSLDPQTRTAKVEVQIPPGHEYLLPNMSVSVSLVKDEKQNAIVVPAEALREEPDGPVVYMYHEGTARAQKVKVGLNNGIMVEIIEGIDAGEQVITSAPMHLKSGDKVFLYKGVNAD